MRRVVSKKNLQGERERKEEDSRGGRIGEEINRN